MTRGPMTVWRKGGKSPEKGVPYRHTRDKALLLDGATPGQADSVLRILIAHDPRPVLGALIAVLEGEPGEGEVPQWLDRVPGCETAKTGNVTRKEGK